MYVIKTYQPHSGKDRELENVLKTHWDSLHAAGLVSGDTSHHPFAIVCDVVEEA